MDKTPSETIRALDRGLMVIELMSRWGRMTLAQLRKETGLSNPTLYRVLATLIDRGWVRRNIVEGQYELSHSLGQTLGGATHAHPLAEAAAPVLLNMTTLDHGWPSDVCAVQEVGQIEIVESTRLRGPMAPSRTGLGQRPSMVLSAHGRVILAHCKPATKRLHLNRLRQYLRRDEKVWLESDRLEAELKITRDRGYGLREPGYGLPPFDPTLELGAMAVAIPTRGGIAGSVSLLWVIEDTPLKEVLATGALDELRRAAARIGATLARDGFEAPLP